MSSVLNRCDACKITFSGASKLRLHNRRLHSAEVIVSVNGVSKKVLRNKNGVFPCPYCSNHNYASPDSLKRHLRKHSQNQGAKTTSKVNNKKKQSQRYTESDDKVENDTGIDTSLSNARRIAKDPRDYKTTILSAFDALNQPSKDQRKKLLIAELGDLKPVTYIGHDGKEHSLLAAPKVIDHLIFSQKKEERSLFVAITPKKRNHSGQEI